MTARCDLRPFFIRHQIIGTQLGDHLIDIIRLDGYVIDITKQLRGHL